MNLQEPSREPTAPHAIVKCNHTESLVSLEVNYLVEASAFDASSSLSTTTTLRDSHLAAILFTSSQNTTTSCPAPTRHVQRKNCSSPTHAVDIPAQTRSGAEFSPFQQLNLEYSIEPLLEEAAHCEMENEEEEDDDTEGLPLWYGPHVEPWYKVCTMHYFRQYYGG
ncbi:hypothetical protein BC629DRAFT_1439480 [Irpex lacteus]|nr:hypothetical protein BC629DRAFT_1439480 [Irpex lacteus]